MINLNFVFINREVSRSVFEVVIFDFYWDYKIDKLSLTDFNIKFKFDSTIILNTDPHFRQLFPQYCAWPVPYPGYEIKTFDQFVDCLKTGTIRPYTPNKAQVDTQGMLFLIELNNDLVIADCYGRYQSLSSLPYANIIQTSCKILIRKRHLSFVSNYSSKIIVVDISDLEFDKFVRRTQIGRRVIKLKELTLPTYGFIQSITNVPDIKTHEIDVTKAFKKKKEDPLISLYSFVTEVLDSVGASIQPSLLFDMVSNYHSSVTPDSPKFSLDIPNIVTEALRRNPQGLKLSEIHEWIYPETDIELDELYTFIKFMKNVHKVESRFFIK